jgi:hypothetical protein
MGAAALLFQWFWPVGPESPALWKASALVGAILISGVVYGGLVFGFRVPEVQGVLASLRARLNRRAAGPAG